MYLCADIRKWRVGISLCNKRNKIKIISSTVSISEADYLTPCPIFKSFKSISLALKYNIVLRYCVIF